MKIFFYILITFWAVMLSNSFAQPVKSETNTVSKTAAQILDNPENLAICYRGFRVKSPDIEPTIPGLKEDLEIPPTDRKT